MKSRTITSADAGVDAAARTTSASSGPTAHDWREGGPPAPGPPAESARRRAWWQQRSPAGRGITRLRVMRFSPPLFCAKSVAPGVTARHVRNCHRLFQQTVHSTIVKRFRVGPFPRKPSGVGCTGRLYSPSSKRPHNLRPRSQPPRYPPTPSVRRLRCARESSPPVRGAAHEACAANGATNGPV